MEDEFDVNAAVDDIGAGLGFDSTPEKEDDDVALEVEAPKPEAAEPVAPASPSTDVQKEIPPIATADEAPKTWRKEASATWAALPSEAKAEILKRENDIFQGIEAMKPDANYGKAFKSVLAPYAEILRANNMEPVATVNNLLQAHHLFATGSPEAKLQLFQKMARDYNIPLSPPGEAPYIDPTVAALQSELNAVKSQLSQTSQRQQQVAAQEVSKQVNAFASDPKNVYFDEVADDIAVMISKGVAKDLQDAYEKAIWANPVTRAKEIARTTAEASAKAADEAKAKAAAVRKSTAANVVTRARSGNAAIPLGSLDDTLEAQLAKIKARA